MTSREPTLSVVVPIYNEESVLALLVERLRPVLDGLDEPYEVVAVDDGSSDATPVILAGTRRNWPQLRVIRLRRNSGHQAALTAGLFRARGRYVASIDADLQDPPEILVEMLRLARAEGLDIVYGVRGDRSTDTRFKRHTAGVYYRLVRRLVGNTVPAQAGDFRLLSRATVEALRELPERRPVLRLVVPWLGFPSGEVSYIREARAAGRTKYSLSRMVRLATDSIISFSEAPLRVATWLGAGGMLLCLAMVVFAVVMYFRDSTVTGWASLYVAVLFLGAVQLLCLGLLGEYIARIYAAVQGRPAYFVGSDTADATEEPDLATATANLATEEPSLATATPSLAAETPGLAAEEPDPATETPGLTTADPATATANQASETSGLATETSAAGPAAPAAREAAERSPAARDADSPASRNGGMRVVR